jgi:hypothetical protein
MTNPEFSMIAPGQQSRKRDDVKLLEQGPNVGILYSIVDCGTQLNTHFSKKKRVIRFTFEFPMLKQLFNVDDTEPRPTVVSLEMTYQVAERSTLRKFIEGALGKTLQPHEYENGYDVGQFLGQVMMCNIVNQTSKNPPYKTYNKIASVQAITEHIKSVYSIDWNLITRTNPLSIFAIDPQGACFQSQEFSKLPNFLREKLMGSDEGVAYAQSGGQFIAQAEYNPQGNGTAQAQPIQQQQVAAPIQREPQAPAGPGNPTIAEKKLVMVATDYTYEQYIASGWTDDALVQGGKAKWEEVQPPAPQTPPPPAAQPTAPPPQMQQPVAPQQPQQPMQPPAQQPISPPDLRIGSDNELIDMNAPDPNGLQF